MEEDVEIAKLRHLAGVIPVAAPPLDFKMPWHDCMMPISQNFLAVENAVYQAVIAGCHTIWIVCHLGMQPLLRKRIGDYVYYPDRNKPNDKSRYSKYSSIFYIPIHPLDRDRRDSLGWSFIYGVKIAYWTCRGLSRWITPDKFYCSFPYGITDSEYIRKYSKILRSKKKCVMRYNGKTIKDGLYTGFTFQAKDFTACKNYIKHFATNRLNEENDPNLTRGIVLRDLKNLKLEQVFSQYPLEEAEFIDLPWYYDISTWEGYTQFLGSGIKVESQKQLFVTDKERLENDTRRRREYLASQDKESY